MRFRWFLAGLLAASLEFNGLAYATSSAEVLVVVNATNPAAISENQIAALFSGKENRLPSGRRAVVIDQNDQQEIKRIFYQRVLGLSIAEVRAEQARLLFSSRAAPPREAFSSKEVAAIVAANPDAIGFIDSSLLLDNLRVVARWPR